MLMNKCYSLHSLSAQLLSQLANNLYASLMCLKLNMQLLLWVFHRADKLLLSMLLTYSKRLGSFSSFLRKLLRYFLAMSTVQLNCCQGKGEGVNSTTDWLAGYSQLEKMCACTRVFFFFFACARLDCGQMAPSVEIEPHTQNTKTGQVLRRSHLGTFSQLNCSVCTGAYMLKFLCICIRQTKRRGELGKIKMEGGSCIDK